MRRWESVDVSQESHRESDDHQEPKREQPIDTVVRLPEETAPENDGTDEGYEQCRGAHHQIYRDHAC